MATGHTIVTLEDGRVGYYETKTVLRCTVWSELLERYNSIKNYINIPWLLVSNGDNLEEYIIPYDKIPVVTRQDVSNTPIGEVIPISEYLPVFTVSVNRRKIIRDGSGQFPSVYKCPWEAIDDDYSMALLRVLHSSNALVFAIPEYASNRNPYYAKIVGGARIYYNDYTQTRDSNGNIISYTYVTERNQWVKYDGTTATVETHEDWEG